MHSFTVFVGSSSGEINVRTTNRPELVGDQVFIRVTASGLCGTDLHFRKSGIGLGHEGVGVVEQLGPECTRLQKGDRVGWGYQHDCCGSCTQCLKGNETFCPQRKTYSKASLDQGSMAECAIWRETFLHLIPSNISNSDAAPLMCAGATVFNALLAQPKDTMGVVGVLGIGGLGHLAIQFARAMGHRVIAFSTSEDKRQEAMDLGAHVFVSGSTECDYKSLELTRLLITTSAHPPLEAITQAMAPCSTIIPLYVDDTDLRIPYSRFFDGGLRWQASIGAPRHVFKAMLEFAACHDIKPIIEKFPMTAEGCDRAMTRLERGEMRYRGVLTKD
ncbi:hypothetical protein LTR86_010414 [Recurvomyces mirabilis]|nr:hypothetical protein LTR86_010414 [Recurvomyces mirabilis]